METVKKSLILPILTISLMVCSMFYEVKNQQMKFLISRTEDQGQ